MADLPGHHQRVDKIGDEPVPRIALRILAEQRAERARLEQSLQFATASQSIWRNGGRTDSKKQDVLLFFLWGVAASPEHFPERRGCSTAAERNGDFFANAGSETS